MFKFKTLNNSPHLSFSTQSTSTLGTTSSLASSAPSSTSAKSCSLCPLYKNILCLIIGLIIGIRFTDIWFNLQNETLTTIIPATPTATTTTTLTATSALSLEASETLFNTTRVLCWILTNPNNHLTKAIHIRHTWGRRCNKLLFMSTEEDNDLPAIKLDVEEGRENLWNKTRLALKYIYDHHGNDAEWFLKADDDTYVIMENLRYFLYQYPSEAAIYFGAKFKHFVKQGYMSGGAGYVLSQESLKKFATEAYDDAEKCGETYQAEDVQLGMCLENIGVIAGDSRDQEGRERFLPMPIEYLIPEDKTWWYKNYSYYPQRENVTCCSPSAISFHYIVADQFYVLEYFLYSLRVMGFNNRIELPKKIPLANILIEDMDNFEPIPEPPVDVT